MNWEELVGKKVKNKITGEVILVESYSESPSVQLDNGIGFCVGSPVSKEYEVVEEKKPLSDKLQELRNFYPNTAQYFKIQDQLSRVGHIKLITEKEKEQLMRCVALFKESLKEYFEFEKETFSCVEISIIKDKRKEIFGDGLID